MAATAAGIERIPGEGWLALLGGGEFSYGETFDVDEVWVAKTLPGPIGFIPAASGSNDYAQHFSEYLSEELERELEVIPIYRSRDARRGRNSERIAAVPAVYLGGGVADHLLDALAGSPAAESLTRKIQTGGMVVAIAAAAQAAGCLARSIAPGQTIPGLGWLPEGVIEPNFDPGHDRRLRKLLDLPGVRWGLGIPAESAVLLGPGGAVEVVGNAFYLEGSNGEMEVLEGPPPGEL
ncbi:MAG TPA: Type 1 glutamine amidotransferase-like domain-containing protein [Thermoanaerobaculia bacterium]|nr:Type 1 glutamine amidotransferase-like domain-containing protein [Thermoanaerobaculia bacterium]